MNFDFVDRLLMLISSVIIGGAVHFLLKDEYSKSICMVLFSIWVTTYGILLRTKQ